MLHQQRNQHARLIPVELYMSDKIIHLTDDSFDTDVLKADGAILVDFWAEWCAPCRMLSPIVDQVAEELTDIKVAKVNIDDEQDLALQYNVMSIPTLLVFKGGQLVKRSVGVISKNDIKELVLV